MLPRADVIVAGHLCLDIIPEMEHLTGDEAILWRPGTLHQIGPAVLATGGAVSNTGISLHRLGVRTRLLGKVGDDPMGAIVRSLLDKVDPALGKYILVSKGETTSYSLVLSPGKNDRLFLHHSGANDTYTAADVPAEMLVGARHFHFGYPPNMRGFYSDGGKQLETLFTNARSAGLTTSLDMTQPDRQSEAGRVDWRALLRRVLPLVDLFLPSFDEIAFMLGYDSNPPDAAALEDVSSELLTMGSAVVTLKLGDQGLFLRTSEDSATMARMSSTVSGKNWTGRHLLAPCFAVKVAGTTGSGDSTIAGFLAALLRGLSPEESLEIAVAVGAHCVEQSDATSGVPTWESLASRLVSPWPRNPVRFAMPGWKWDEATSLWVGPADVSRRSGDRR